MAATSTLRAERWTWPGIICDRPPDGEREGERAWLQRDIEPPDCRTQVQALLPPLSWPSSGAGPRLCPWPS